MKKCFSILLNNWKGWGGLVLRCKRQQEMGCRSTPGLGPFAACHSPSLSSCLLSKFSAVLSIKPKDPKNTLKKATRKKTNKLLSSKDVLSATKLHLIFHLNMGFKLWRLRWKKLLKCKRQLLNFRWIKSNIVTFDVRGNSHCLVIQIRRARGVSMSLDMLVGNRFLLILLIGKKTWNPTSPKCQLPAWLYSTQ